MILLFLFYQIFISIPITHSIFSFLSIFSILCEFFMMAFLLRRLRWFRSVSFLLLLFVFVFVFSILWFWSRPWNLFTFLSLLNLVSSLSFALFVSLKFSPVIIFAAWVYTFLSVLRVLQIHLGKKIFFEGFRQGFDMHIVAETSSSATSINILLALSIHEISNRWKFSFYFFIVEKTTINMLHCIFCIVLVWILNIDIADNMIAQIIDHNHILNITIFHHLFEDFLIKVFVFYKCIFCIRLIDYTVTINQGNLYCIIFIHMFEADRFRNRRFVMNSLAAVTIPACTHFVEERAIDFVHFSPINFG